MNTPAEAPGATPAGPVRLEVAQGPYGEIAKGNVTISNPRRSPVMSAGTKGLRSADAVAQTGEERRRVPEQGFERQRSEACATTPTQRAQDEKSRWVLHL